MRGLWQARRSIGAPVLHGFGHVRQLRSVCAGQVCDAAGHLERAVRAAGRPAQASGGQMEELRRRVVEQHMGVDLAPVQVLVRLALARDGAFGCLDERAGLAAAGLQQVGRGHGRHIDMQVDAVEQRAAELALVARDLVRCAAASPLR